MACLAPGCVRMQQAWPLSSRRYGSFPPSPDERAANRIRMRGVALTCPSCSSINHMGSKDGGGGGDGAEHPLTYPNSKRPHADPAALRRQFAHLILNHPSHFVRAEP